MITILIVLIIISLVSGFVIFSPQFGQPPKGEHLERISKSPQYKDTKFFNPNSNETRVNFSDSMFLLWEIIRGNPNRRPKQKLPSRKLQVQENADSFLTWFGHSTFLYEVSGKKILFDPMLGKHASPVPFAISRYNYELPSSAKDLPELDAVIISHDHYDHLDYGTIQILKNKTKMFFTPLGVGAHLVRWGVKKEKIVELDWWQEANIENIRIISVPSQHFSGRFFTSQQKTLWSAWVIQSPQASVLFGGDSGYFPGFKEIGNKYGPFDLTLLDSAQYNKHWETVHMFPEQSVLAHKELQGKVFMPIHWSAFTLSLHGWTDPIERALIAAEKEKVVIITPMIGERFHVLNDRPQIRWWR